MSEPWQSEPAHTENLKDHAHRVVVTMRALGVMKPGEEARVLHMYGCSYPKDYSAPCTCVAGPEIMWSDFDEMQPRRYYQTPERFYVRH